MTEEESLSEATIFEVLSSPRRRYVLYVLHDRGGSATLNDAAETVAAWENGVPVEAITSQQRKRVYVSLYQTHVPALAEAGVVAYDDETGEIARGAHAGDIERYLGGTGPDDRWPRYYLGLSVACVLVAGVGASTGAVPTVAAALVVAVAFGALAVVHLLSLRRTALGAPGEFDRFGDP